ncbi:MAG: hypothetical protein QW794_05075 [Thermosphaera sp.]
MEEDKERKELEELVVAVLKLKEEDRERLRRILTQYPKQKIILALHNAYMVTKHGKTKPIVTLEEFEQIVKKTRF